MTCRHENADHLMPGDVYDAPMGEFAVAVEQFRCLDCGHWLSLGPSADDSEAVRVEIRAAEFIACHVTDSACRCFETWRRLPRATEQDALDLAVQHAAPGLPMTALTLDDIAELERYERREGA